MQIRFRSADDGTVIGACHIPTAGGVITVAGIGDSKTEALAKAALLAERIASDPVLSAVLPPGTLAAIRVTKGLAAASAHGVRTLRSFWSRLQGPGKQRLANALATDHGVSDLGDVGFSWKKAAMFAANPMLAAQYFGGKKAGKYAVKKIKRKLAQRRAAQRRREREEMESEMPEEMAPEEEAIDAEYSDNADNEGGEQ